MSPFRASAKPMLYTSLQFYAPLLLMRRFGLQILCMTVLSPSFTRHLYGIKSLPYAHRGVLSLTILCTPTHSSFVILNMIFPIHYYTFPS